MSTRLDKSIQSALNDQIQKEAFASHFYLALAYWSDEKALAGCKEFFIRQYNEEREHMMKIYEYLSDCDCCPETRAIDQPDVNFSSVKEVFTAVLEQEKSVTESIHTIVKKCYELADFGTLHFLQWFVEEQREEEVLIKTILDKIEVIGEGTQSLYYIDKEISEINDLALKGQV